RIGHGISAAQDARLLEHLASHAIPLEVCPTSNLRTRAVGDLTDHPFDRLREPGVRVTLNSDDPGMLSTTLHDENRLARDAVGPNGDALLDVAKTAVRASYASESGRNSLLAEIDGYAGGFERA